MLSKQSTAGGFPTRTPLAVAEPVARVRVGGRRVTPTKDTMKRNNMKVVVWS